MSLALLLLACRLPPPDLGGDKWGDDTGTVADGTPTDGGPGTRTGPCVDWLGTDTDSETDTLTLPETGDTAEPAPPGACWSDSGWDQDTGPEDTALPFVLDDADWRVKGEPGTANQIGESVGSVAGHACDLTGDGVDDLVVGAIYAGGFIGLGAAFVFPGPLGDGQPALSDAAMTFSDTREGGVYGGSPACGDLDGDGVDDLYVPSNTYQPDYVTGDVYSGPLFPGAHTVAEATGSVDIESMWAAVDGPGFAMTGAPLAVIPDTDGDGFDDLLLGSPKQTHPSYAYGVGGAWLVHGPIVGTLALEGEGYLGTNDNMGFISYLGTSVASAGDMNGDGLGDFALGGWGDGVGHTGGEAYLIRGPHTGLALVDDVAIAHLQGETYGESFGQSMSGGEDVDGDGQTDLAIGAPHSPFDVEPGTVYLYYHEPRGEQTAHYASDACIHGDLIVSQTGTSVQLADVDGDGFGDVIITSLGATADALYQGAVYVAFGPIHGHYDLVGSPRVYGEDAYDGSEMTVAAGDFDADGMDDVVVGVTDHDKRGGGAWVVDGWRWAP